MLIESGVATLLIVITLFLARSLKLHSRNKTRQNALEENRRETEDSKACPNDLSTAVPTKEAKMEILKANSLKMEIPQTKPIIQMTAQTVEIEENIREDLGVKEPSIFVDHQNGKGSIDSYVSPISSRADFKESSPRFLRISTAIPGFDGLLKGGFPSDSMVLIVGHPGAGKTIFSAQFFYAQVMLYGMRGVYVSFAETKDTFLKNMLRFGWDFEVLEKSGRVAILDLDTTAEEGLQKSLDIIMEAVKSIKANMLIIDSFTSITMALKDQIGVRELLHHFYRFLKEKGCFCIFIVDQPWGSKIMGNGIEEFVSDGIIFLNLYADKNGILRKKVSVLKMRSSNHAKKAYEYDIAEEGFKLKKKIKSEEQIETEQIFDRPIT